MTITSPKRSQNAAGSAARPVRLIERMLAVLPDDLGAFRELGGEVTDWSALLACADGHGVGALLHHYASAAGCCLPPAVEAHVERQRVYERLLQSPLHAALDQALAALEAA